MNGSDEAGRIRAGSAGAGPGARFTFTLPAAAEAGPTGPCGRRPGEGVDV